MLRHRQEDRLSPRQVALATKTKQQQALTASCPLAADKGLHLALIAGAVYDQKLGKWMQHKQLISHPDPKIRKLWAGGNEKVFGRLCQGYDETKGKDVLKFIQEDEVPAHKPVTYPRFTAAYRPKKAS